MKVLVSGGRDYDNWKKVHETLDTFHNRYGITKIIHGAAKGADFHASTWATKNKVEHTGDTYKPDWDGLGKAAGVLRNNDMLLAENPDLVIVFPGGKGTTHMRGISSEMGVPTLVVPDQAWKPFDLESAFRDASLKIDVLEEIDELDDALSTPPWEEEEGVETPEPEPEPTKPYWASPPVKKWPVRVHIKPTPDGRYDSMF